jgi:hypothetical protein
LNFLSFFFVCYRVCFIIWKQKRGKHHKSYICQTCIVFKIFWICNIFKYKNLYSSLFKLGLPVIYINNTEARGRKSFTSICFVFFPPHNIVYSKSPIYNNLNGPGVNIKGPCFT